MHRVACWGHFYCLTHLQIKIKFHKSCRLVQNCLFRLGSMLVSIYTVIHFCQNSFYNDFMLHNPFFTTIAIGHCVLSLSFTPLLSDSVCIIFQSHRNNLLHKKIAIYDSSCSCFIYTCVSVYVCICLNILAHKEHVMTSLAC